MTDDARRKCWNEHFKRWTRSYNQQEKNSHHGIPNIPDFPDALRGLTCGAKTRKDTPCKITDLRRGGRCKFHGGGSTGPRTEAGKLRSAANLPKTKLKNAD